MSFFRGRRYGRRMCYVNYRPMSSNSNGMRRQTTTEEDPTKPSTSGYQGDSEDIVGRDGPSTRNVKRKRGQKKIPDLVRKWIELDEDCKAKAMTFMKKCIISPFLFHYKYNYSSKVISWLQNGKLLPKCLSSKNISLSDEDLKIADFIEAVIDHVFTGINTEMFLQDISLCASDANKCTGIAEVVSLSKEQWKKLIMDIRTNILVDSSLDEENIFLGIVVVVCQVVKHAKQAVGIKSPFQMKLENKWRKKQKESEKRKSEGNKMFSEANYQSAVDVYTEALSLSPFSHILFGNRAQSYLKLGQFREALSDARRAVFLEPTWEKGHYRLAEAYQGLGFLDKAITVNTRAQVLCGETTYLKDQAVKFRKAQNPSSIPTMNSARLASHDDSEMPDLCSASEDEHDFICHCHCQCEDEEDTYYTCDSMPELLSSEEECCAPCMNGSNTHHQALPNDTHHSFSSSSSSPPFPEGSLDLDDMDSIPSLDSSSAESVESLLNIGDDLSDEILGDEITENAPELISDSDSDLDYSENSDGEIFGRPFDEPGEIAGSNAFMTPFMSPGMEILRQLSLATFNNFDAAMEAFQRLEAALQESDGDSAPPPALPAVIESLPSIKITQEQVDGKLTCPICHCEYELNEDVLLLPCDHIYHSPCVTTWLKMHATCPTCRHVLPY